MAEPTTLPTVAEACLHALDGVVTDHGRVALSGTRARSACEALR